MIDWQMAADKPKPAQALLLAGLCLPWLSPLAAGPSPTVLQWLVTLACFALVLPVLAQWRADAARTVAQAWLLAALLSCAAGLLQYFGVSAALSPWVNATGVGEAYANLRQRNQFATLSNIGLAALLWFAAHARAHQARLIASRAGLLAAAVLLAAGNAASSSRTGLVQLLLLGALVWLWGGLRQPQTRRLLAVALAAYAVAALALPALLGLDPAEHGMWGRLSSGDLACGSRLTLWGNVLHLMAQKPGLGWGWGELGYAHFITLYPGPRFCELLDNAHNLPLHLAVELGLPAALLMCAGAGWLVLRERPWRERDATRQLAWSVLALILLHSLLEYPLWYGPFQLAFGLSLVLLWTTRPVHPGPALSRPAPARAIRLGAAVLLLAVAAGAAWDYHRVSQIYLEPAARSAAYRDDTLEKIQASWLFRRQARFAWLTITPLTRANAAQINSEAQALLHFSPEPRVIEKLVESAVLLGRDDEALFYLVRYRAAFPADHARWAAENALLE